MNIKTINVHKAARNLERAAELLNRRFNTKGFRADEQDDFKILVFRGETLAMVNRKKKEFPELNYNPSSVVSMAIDKIQSLIFKGDLECFPVTKRNQEVLILKGDWKGKKVRVLDPNLGRETAFVYLDGEEVEFNKDILGVIG